MHMRSDGLCAEVSEIDSRSDARSSMPLRRCTRDETVRSIDLSPKSTMSPPCTAGLTRLTNLTLLPAFAAAESFRIFSSRDCEEESSCWAAVRHQ